MSHEIRTPMNGIIGMTELALNTELTREQREYLNMVRSSADSLLTVINDILDFSKIEAGKLDLFPTAFNLRDELGDTLKTLAVRAHTKELELACHISPDVPDALIGDPARLRQIVINLVGNAIKFTERGEVVVHVELEPEQPNGTWLHFAVRDTGIGIATDEQRAIFDPFVQQDGSAVRKFGGTGLGLTISSRLVQLMEGRIWVESELAKGSTFHFTARFAAQRRPEPEALSSGPALLENLPVLVVDDNATNRRILEEMLAHWRMKPTVVDGGLTALAELNRAALAGEPFRFVLLDALMPEMDGFTLAWHIRQNVHAAGSKLLILSSADRQPDDSRCRKLDICAYLIKPIKQSELLNALLTALNIPASSRQPAEHGPGMIGSTTRMQPVTPRPLHILLAEDNVVNQKLAVLLLEHQGHRVVVASTGRDALALLDQQPFDLVLMDVQMPEMDGFEATRAIRMREEESGRHIPIIAMTAHAMKGDRERCLEAGMDGYVSKPIQAPELWQAIEDLALKGANSAVDSSAAGLQEKRRHEAALRSALGDHAEHLESIAPVFLDESERLTTAIREAIAGNDAQKLTNAAHTLKGSVGIFGAAPAYDAAQQLESMGRSGELSGAEQACAALERELGQIKSTILRIFAH